MMLCTIANPNPVPPEAWARDEWDLALQSEEAISFYRLVHDLLGGGWFVEGTYD